MAIHSCGGRPILALGLGLWACLAPAGRAADRPLDVHRCRWRNERLRLDWRIPARKAFTMDGQPRSVGWFVAPRINLDLRDIAGHAGGDVGTLIGPLFADRQYQDYFYSVAPS